MLRGFLKSLQPRISRVVPKTQSYMSFLFLQPPRSKVEWNKREWVGWRDIKGVHTRRVRRGSNSEVGLEWKTRNKKGEWKRPENSAGYDNTESMTGERVPGGEGTCTRQQPSTPTIQVSMWTMDFLPWLIWMYVLFGTGLSMLDCKYELHQP